MIRGPCLGCKTRFGGTHRSPATLRRGAREQRHLSRGLHRSNRRVAGCRVVQGWEASSDSMNGRCDAPMMRTVRPPSGDAIARNRCAPTCALGACHSARRRLPASWEAPGVANSAHCAARSAAANASPFAHASSPTSPVASFARQCEACSRWKLRGPCARPAYRSAASTPAPAARRPAHRRTGPPCTGGGDRAGLPVEWRASRFRCLMRPALASAPARPRPAPRRQPPARPRATVSS